MDIFQCLKDFQQLKFQRIFGFKSLKLKKEHEICNQYFQKIYSLVANFTGMNFGDIEAFNMAILNTYPFDVARGKTYEKFQKWNCGVELKQNKFGTYTRVQGGLK